MVCAFSDLLIRLIKHSRVWRRSAKHVVTRRRDPVVDDDGASTLHFRQVHQIPDDVFYELCKRMEHDLKGNVLTD